MRAMKNADYAACSKTMAVQERPAIHYRLSPCFVLAKEEFPF